VEILIQAVASQSSFGASPRRNLNSLSPSFHLELPWVDFLLLFPNFHLELPWVEFLNEVVVSQFSSGASLDGNLNSSCCPEFSSGASLGGSLN